MSGILQGKIGPMYAHVYAIFVRMTLNLARSLLSKFIRIIYMFKIELKGAVKGTPVNCHPNIRIIHNIKMEIILFEVFVCLWTDIDVNNMYHRYYLLSPLNPVKAYRPRFPSPIQQFGGYFTPVGHQ